MSDPRLITRASARARVVRAAVALVERRPSQTEAWREIIGAVWEWKTFEKQQGESPESENGYEQSDDHDGTGTSGQDAGAVRGSGA